MSLHTIVGEQLADRFRTHRAPVETTQPKVTEAAIRLRGTSMRVLETALAFTAIATAVLLGLAR